MIIHIQSHVLTSSVNCWAIAFLIRPITVAFSSPIYTLIWKCTEQANVISKVITVKPPLTAASPLHPPPRSTPDNGHFILSRRTIHTLTLVLLLKPLYNGNGHQLLACPHLPKWPLDKGKFFQRLMKKSRMVMKFDPCSTLMINVAIMFWLCFIYTSAVSINHLQYL